MARYIIETHVEAPPEIVFDLWTNLERNPEWIGGLTGYTDITGPLTVAGTRYTARFGRMSSPTEVIDVERPHRFSTRFGNRLLRGTNRTTFEAAGSGTRLTQAFETQGFIPAIMAWVFAHGSYAGSFKGELEAFGRLAEAEAKSRAG